MDKKIKIMIAMPVARFIETECFMSIYNMEIPEGVETTFLTVDGYSVDVNRNAIVKFAIDGKADYIFWVDSDIILPKNALTRLYEANLPIVSGIYAMKDLLSKKTVAMLRNKEKDNYVPLVYEAMKDYKLIEVDAIGFGCMLIRMDVFDSIKPPYFVFTNNFGEDIDFCRKAQNAGYQIIVDTNVTCGHVGFVNFNIKGDDTK